MDFDRAIIEALTLFLLGFLVHLAVWRVRRPRRQILVLAVLFGALVPCLGRFAGAPSLLLYALLATAYLLSYPAAQAHCPSLEILSFVAARGDEGASLPEILGQFTAKDLVGSRVQDLLDEGLLVEVPGRLPVLTWRARLVLRMMVALRRILGLPEGQG